MLRIILNEARGGRPDLAATRLGKEGYSPRGLKVLARYGESESRLASPYVKGRDKLLHISAKQELRMMLRLLS